MTRQLLLLALVALALPARAALPPPVAASYARGAQFEVAGYDASKPALSGFPVLVRIANDSPSGFAYSQLQSPSTGADLCFIDMNGNGLPFEIDTWDPDGTSLVWVTLPSMEHGTQFVMCWGSATSGKTVCADNPFAGYKGVWHMDSVDPDDSTPNGFDGTHRTDNLSAVNGPVGTAVNVPRVNNSDGITCGNVIPNPELTGGFTVEGWCRPTQYGGMGDGAAMFGKRQFVSIRIASGSQVTVTTPGKSDHKLTGLALPAVNTWWHWAVTFKMNTGTDGLKLYVNGQCVKTAGAGDINDKTGTTEVFLGNNEWNQAFKGDLDEIRLSAGLKSADWIAAEHATVANRAFLSAGAVEAYDAGAPELGTPTLSRNADGTFTVTVEVSVNDAAPGTVKCAVGAAEFPLSSSGTSLPKTYAGTISGLAADTTFTGSVQAESATGTVVSRPLPAAFHTGDLSVAKIADANKFGLDPL